MNNAKAAAVLLSGLLVLSLGVGTYGAVHVSGDRTVTIEVAEDNEQPYLDTDVHSPRLPNGRHTEVPLLTLRHRLDHESSLRVRASVRADSDESTPPNVLTGPRLRTLDVGEEVTLTASVVCGSDGGDVETFTVDVVAEGSRTSLSFSRDVVVTCTGEPNRGESGQDDERHAGQKERDDG